MESSSGLPSVAARGTPVKLTVTVGAQLHLALKDYAELYQVTYGTAEQVIDMIPYMLEGFLSSDKRFVRGGRK